MAATVPLGGTQTFHATVSGSSDTGVTWKVNGVTGGASATGTIDASGVYTAPPIIHSPAVVTVTAASHADPIRDGNARVTVISDVTVVVQPATASVELGAVQNFAAVVTGSGSPLPTVTWAVTGTSCTGAACGTVTSGATSTVYTAPGILPASPTATVTATSDADSSKTGLAAVVITSHFTLSVSGPASLNPAATAQFVATLMPLPGSNPNTQMTWTIGGVGCAGSGNPCGMITSAGVFTAPAAAPQPNSITVTATSVADPSKSASALTSVVTQPAVVVTPTNASVALEQTRQFTAVVSGLANTSVLWSVNGISGGDPATVGTISNAASNGLYAAPVNMVAGRMVTVTAKSVSNMTLSASVAVQLTSNISVRVTPLTASRTTGTVQTFTAAVTGTSNPNISWTVNGVPNGNAIFGQICVTGISPCVPPSLSVAPGSVDYLAPASVPSSPIVSVQATSVADPTQFASASLTILSRLALSLSPSSATIPPTGTQTFLATVMGTADQNVIWDVNGFINGAVNLGVICLPGSSPCQAPAGAISGPMEYRAPSIPPAPVNTVMVRATSELGASISQAAAVTVGSGPFIFLLLPASVSTSVTQPFPMRVEGVQFLAGGSGVGSTVMLAGIPKSTNCPNTTECDVTVNPQDVASAGMVAVTMQNPGPPPVGSNAVNLVVVAPDTTEDIISLTAGNPVATGKDIVVVEPPTAGDPSVVALTLQRIGLFDVVGNACQVGPNVVAVTRPITGTMTFSLCLVGTNLSAANAVDFSQPLVPDVSAANLNVSLGSIILGFTMTVPANAQPGLRSVFVIGVNSQKAVLTGSLEVK
ncbi:MAG: hypothetical protein GZ088_12675 [Acidipila sp.]|nr:hypothetical protein [Acidipila sp.]